MTEHKKVAVQFGAGNIGRGFVGQLFSEAGMEVVYVDVVEEVVNRLNQDHRYTITIAKEPQEEFVTIDGVRAVNGRDMERVAAELSEADIAATAVGVNVIATIAKPIAAGLKLRRAASPARSLNIIVCENMRDAAGYLKAQVYQHLDSETAGWADQYAGFSQAVVGRMVPLRTDEEKRTDPIGVRVEPYKKLPIDKDQLRGEIPAVAGILPKGNFQAYIDQKLFAHNAGHAASAYFGYPKGHTYIWECMLDIDVRNLTKQLMTETGEALIKCYNMDAEEHWEHVEDLLQRFANRKLGDTVARVGADPLRKLGRDDRLVGAGLFCLENGIRPEYVAQAIAMGYKFDNKDDASAVEVQKAVETVGIEGALEKVSGISASEELGRMVVQAYHSL